MPGPILGLLLAILLLLAPQRAETRDVAPPVAAIRPPPRVPAIQTRPRAPAIPVSRTYRTDALLIRLSEEAARRLTRSRGAGRLEGEPGRHGRAMAVPTRVERLRLPGV